MIGDIMQRIGDHNRIESFLTGSSVATLFSFVNFFIFGWILACYNPVILGIFLAGNTLYVCWVLVFMKYRRELDIRRFAQAAGGTEQPDTAGDRHAGDKAEQLREAEKDGSGKGFR